MKEIEKKVESALFDNSVRDMRLSIAAHYEAGNPRIAELIKSEGVCEVFNRIPHEQRVDVAEIYGALQESSGTFLIPEDREWPESFNHLKAPPVGVFVRGDVAALSGRSLAIVGTRHPTPYGIRIAQEFATGFVDREWSIVSGGAYGIDSAAHKGALIAEGVTVAVTASGLDSNYPAGNQRLFDEIADSGAIVTEYLPGATAKHTCC
jgi:DNA processing protein